MIESRKFRNSRKYDLKQKRTVFQSEMIELVRGIEAAAKDKGLTLSRWQTNYGNYACTIRYALHTGERAAQMRYQNGVVESIEFENEEGSTRHCMAYREIAEMANRAGIWG